MWIFDCVGDWLLQPLGCARITYVCIFKFILTNNLSIVKLIYLLFRGDCTELISLPKMFTAKACFGALECSISVSYFCVADTVLRIFSILIY